MKSRYTDVSSPPRPSSPAETRSADNVGVVSTVLMAELWDEARASIARRRVEEARELVETAERVKFSHD